MDHHVNSPSGPEFNQVVFVINSKVRVSVSPVSNWNSDSTFINSRSNHSRNDLSFSGSG